MRNLARDARPLPAKPLICRGLWGSACLALPRKEGTRQVSARAVSLKKELTCRQLCPYPARCFQHQLPLPCNVPGRSCRPAVTPVFSRLTRFPTQRCFEPPSNHPGTFSWERSRAKELAAGMRGSGSVLSHLGTAKPALQALPQGTGAGLDGGET